MVHLHPHVDVRNSWHLSILPDKIKTKRFYNNQKVVQLPRASTWSKNVRKVNSTQSASVICTLLDAFLILKRDFRMSLVR